MARMYKITAYIVDPNNVYDDGEQCFADMIERKDVFSPTPIQHEMVEFEWDDNVPVNYVGCTAEDCRRFMDDRK